MGAAASVQVDVRVVAATNKHLEEEIERGNFREDLFYRLNVIPFYVPPLRERGLDFLDAAALFDGSSVTTKVKAQIANDSSAGTAATAISVVSGGLPSSVRTLPLRARYLPPCL